MARSTPSSPRWWPTHRTPLLTALAQASVSIGILFLGAMSWFFGSAFQMRYRVHRLKILVVDFDGDMMGSSLQTAYDAAFASREFPTFDFVSSSKYSSPEAVQEAVCKEGYWGAVYTHEGATDRFRSAVSGSAATAYDSSDAMSYVYSETRYPATSDSYVKSSLAEITGASRSFFYELWNSNSTDVASIDLTNSKALTAFLDPIEAVSVNLAPMSQGAHMYYNTVCMVLPLLTQFFFLMAVNGISAAMGVFTNMAPSRIWMLRLAVAKAHALLLSLVFSGVLWAFREDWATTGLMFARTWMIVWFYMEVNYLFFDSLIGSFIPMQFIAFLVLTWVLMNVASTIFPFELNPGFYRFGYFFPAHEAYTLLVQAWTNGCFKKDYIALPVLFSWWVVGHVTSFISTRKRVADAMALEAAPSKLMDSEEVTLSGDAMTMSGKASQMTRDTDGLTLDQRDVEMGENAGSSEMNK